MQRKVILIGLMVMALLFAIAAAQGGPLTVRTEADKTNYAVGDLVTLKVFVENNPGLHSIYFDLTYDGSVLSFDSLSEGTMVTGELRQKEFLYAVSDPQTSSGKGHHLIVSYALQGPGVVSPRGGLLLEARFRVIAPGNPNIQYKFDYAAKAITDGAGNEISGAVWQAPQSFSIGSGGTGAFVLITKPQEMQVINGDQVEVDAVCSPGSNYYIKYENQTNQEGTDLILANQIDLPSEMIPIVYGYNNIVATLYQRVNGVDYIIATNNVRVYRPQDGLYVKILSPMSHQLVNTDMVDVVVSSPYEQVTVNGLPAVYHEPGTGDHKLYRARLWLKKGFNTITAEATGDDNVKYKDTIQIYYQKDSSIFSFTMPRANEYFKPAKGTYLRIEGEIDSPYRSGAITADGLPAQNTVTLRVIFKPFNYMKDTLVLVNDKLGKIVESTGSIDARSQYKFTHDFEIPLEGLGSGEIEIIAYKNKEGNKWEDEIHRIVYLDDNRLWIDLVQPNVYTHDLLDSEQQILNFNEFQPPYKDNITITEAGEIVLPDGPLVVSKASISNPADIVEAEDGTLYALTNHTNIGISIYKKDLGKTNWSLVLTRPQMHGYALCMTDIGLLVGVSNLYATQESGLYLLKDNKLVNIQFPVSLQHVQFIENRNGMVYIYGNYYNNLYSFNLYTMSEVTNGLKVDSLNRTSFTNNFNLKQFILSADCETAVLRTENDNIYFYNRTDAGYLQTTIEVEGQSGFLSGRNIIAGEYTNGDYNNYLILQDGMTGLSIMEYKKGQRKYFPIRVNYNNWLRNDLNSPVANLTAVGFKDNNFVFLYQSEGSFYLKKGQVFFDDFCWDGIPEGPFNFTNLPGQLSARMFITRQNQYYLGAGSGLSDNLNGKDLYCLYNSLGIRSGEISFNYVNDDIEGLTGFSFEVDPAWLTAINENSIDFSFAVKEKIQGASNTSPNDQVLFQTPGQTLFNLLKESENQFYKLHRQYDPTTKREVIHFEFKTIQEQKYMAFKFWLTPYGNNSPGIFNLKVYKKIHARVCAGAGEEIVLPIQGYVYDRTVTEVTIKQDRVSLGRDGSFNYNYIINRSQNLIPVEISCVNSIGATASLKFLVEIVESKNGLGLIQYRQGGEYRGLTNPELTINEETLLLSGKYYGLEGAVVGYELYGYEYQNGIETAILVKRGLFKTIKSDDVFQDFNTDRNTLGSDYTAGLFQDEQIELIPGRQQLRIYCENPGGLRQVFMVDGKYPEINYQMPESDQKIIFNLEPRETPVVVQNVPIKYQMAMEAFEEEETIGQEKRYVFRRTYELTGEIKSLYNFTDLLVKSFTPGLVLENGTMEQTVAVEAGNRFRIKVRVEMSEGQKIQDFDLGVIPTVPALVGLRTGVRLTVSKCYKDTYFVPDFSGMDPSLWTQTEREELKIPVRVKFNRRDLPFPGCRMTLTVNHDSVFWGYLEPSADNFYILKDQNGQIVKISGLKIGRNRVQWVLEYQYTDTIGQNSYVMCSSISGRPGMNDYLFDLTDTLLTVPTEIQFEPGLSSQYYNNTNLPVLNIVKDKQTEVTVSLNGVPLREDSGVGETNLSNISLLSDALREGSNEIIVTYNEQLPTPISRSFTFLYDSKQPEVAIASWLLAPDDQIVNEITAVVTEANFAKAYLYNGTDILNVQPELTIIASDKYLLRWTGLASYEMDLSHIRVKACDHSGKEGISAQLTSNILRPGEEPNRVPISLPLYKDDPGLAHESNRPFNPFPDHTKFAPRKFLPRESILSQLGDDEDLLVRERLYQKLTAGDPSLEDKFGSAVSISGKYAIIGAAWDDESGKNAGAAYVFKRDENGFWQQTQKLMARHGVAGDQFGCSVAIDGNIAIIGALGDDEKGTDSGAAYIFELDETGWAQRQKLTIDGATGAKFGISVDIFVNNAIIGATNKFVYVFKYTNDTWNLGQQLTINYGTELTNYVEEDWEYRDYLVSRSICSVAITNNTIIIGTVDLRKKERKHRIIGLGGWREFSTYYFGTAYIFELNGDASWSLQKNLTISDGFNNNFYGNAVDISGDVAAVGASKDDDKGDNSGSVYIYERDGNGVWNLRGKITAEDGVADDNFGSSVAISGNKLIVGASGTGNKTGTVYLFEREGSGGSWSQKRKLIANDGASDDNYGSAVALYQNEALIGAFGNDDFSNNSGSAYFHQLSLNHQYLIPTDQKYLVFKVAKGSGINTKLDINGNIRFEAVGIKQGISDPGEAIETQQLEMLDSFCVEGYNHLYYLLELSHLQERYTELCNNYFQLGGIGNGYSIYEQIFFKVRYLNPLTPGLIRDVYLTGNSGDQLKDILFYDPGYETPGSPTQLNPALNHSAASVTTSHPGSAQALTLNFWLRPEDEGLLEPGYIGDTKKRVLTVFNQEGQEVIGLVYQGNRLSMVNSENFDHWVDTNLKTFMDEIKWNMVTLRVTAEQPRTIEVGVNGVWTRFENLLPSVVTGLLAEGNKFYFGPLPGVNYNTGFFSVAGAFYTDQYLDNSEILQLYSLGDQYQNDERTYHFHDGISDFGDRSGELRIVGSGTDYFALYENAEPTQDRSCGSLKASSQLRNFLGLASAGNGNNYVVFENSNCLTYNLTVEGGPESFKVSPRISTGRYHFGDKNSNYGLGLERWYSISGEVVSIDPGTTARLVLCINNQEQSWRLQPGQFHFVFDNREMITPQLVKMYLETDGEAILANNLTLNQGNYILTGNKMSTAAKTLFSFGVTGTVHFWYKPLNANPNGFVNYDAVLFDSELIKIWTDLDNDNDAVFYAALKDANGQINDIRTIKTKVKVRQRWQHLQVSYSLKDSQKLIYFYIDGKLAGFLEGFNFEPFGSLIGNIPTTDNIRIGCDLAQEKFAQGYLDEVVISKYYQREKYTKKQPFALVFDQEQKAVTLSIDEGVNIDSAKYVLEILDRSYKELIENFPIDMTQKPAGRYRLLADLVINGHNYREILFFNIDSRPKFILKEQTPIVFKGTTRDIRFKFGYDLAYRFETDQLQYVGIAAQISNDQGEQIQTRYLVQDFINQNTTRWLLGIVDGEEINWKPDENIDNAGLLELIFPEIEVNSDLSCQFKYFYFNSNFSNENRFENLTEIDLNCIIPLAVLTQPIVPVKDEMGYEYMLVVDITGGKGGSPDPIFREIEIETETLQISSGEATRRNFVLSENGAINGRIELHYDDILSWNGNEPHYGLYTCKLKLKYQGIIYMETDWMQLNWSRKKVEVPVTVVQNLEINEFSQLHIDNKNMENPTASFYLKYSSVGIGNVQAKLEVVSGNTVDERDLINLSSIKDSHIFNRIKIPKGLFKMRVTLSGGGFIRTREIEINNIVDRPEIALTNWVDSLIQYNNVLFSWKGYYHGQFNEGIKYQYNLDNRGWTTPNSQWRSVRFYNLAEGEHFFQVRALYNNVMSEIRQVTFFVDINKPVFDATKINIEKIYDSQGTFYAVKLQGTSGAINDISLNQIIVNGNNVKPQPDGSFVTDYILIKTDGIQKISITAFDKVGNFTDYNISIDNPITEIIYPLPERNVRYSPLTLIGKINSQINAGLKIYVADTQSATKGDYSGWKQAKINPDRTFFVEDLFINPGTAQREILTTLRMACFFDSGKTFEREIQVRANEVLRPIEMKLSTHAAEGENSNTEITIDCRANVPNISTWSIDFDGDGVYDLVDLVKNPSSPAAQEHSWNHKYSTLGLVSPRVRVITTEGDFFSTADTLIIHEKIREASFKMVTEPLAISTVRMMDQSNRVFTLCKKDGQHLVEVYEIRRNDNYISRKLFDIDLTALEIQNPVKLKALDGDNLMIAANIDALGVIYQLRANQFGNYEIVATLYLGDEVADLTIREDMLLASMVHRRDLFRTRMVDGVLDQREAAYESITIANALPLGERAGLETDGNDIFLADYYNQRIIRLSPTLKMVDQFGARGNGEAEFIWPGTIRFHQNRIFVSDSGRHDIQVFDGNYSPICTLGYRNDPEYYNYVEPEFFNDLADFEVIAREEGNRLYYYALVLSRSVGKLSMIRLPQWEELKVRVRNNKIVFVKDGEIFTAKPDGSDLGKVLSSDSLPRIEGMIDYPALAPDGRRLVFTSRIRLYNGEPVAGNIENIYTYDKLYYVNLENKKLSQVDLGSMNGYEIERPVFNSNGSKLIFSAKQPGGKWRIYTYNFESGLVTKLFEVDENARFPYYSPDDQYVVFTSDFGGDEEIEIVNVDNPSVRIAVTKNNCRDSLPVWSTVYPGEIENQDLQKIIKSKIAFVSERNTHKGVYCVYLAQEGTSNLSIYDLKNQQVLGNKPDTAALEVTSSTIEGDYPCFTGDGRNLIFEYYDGRLDLLKKLNFETNLSRMLQGEPLTYEELDLVLGATRPSGMKNMITNFKTEMVNGNELKLIWNRYTDNDIFYIVQYKPVNSDHLYQNHVLSQTGTVVPGMKMGTDYLTRVFIVENDVEVATSYWAKVKMPEVVARPSFTIDPNNPYLVRLHAWKPEPEENYKWRFSWIVENTEIQVQNSRDYMYEFGTSGTKTIFLKAYNEGQTTTHVSEPMEIEIVSDMKPIIEHNLAEDASYIELSAEKSLGKKLNLASAQWIISGPGRDPITATGSKVIVQLDGFQRKINVSLTLQRIAVNNQTDIAQVNKCIDLELKELKPVITYEASEHNKRLIRFSGEYSQGNINWAGVRWTLFADGGVLYTLDGVTAFEYLFPETNQDTVYTVTLSIPRRNDGVTVTKSQIITVEATSIEARIRYEILEMKQGDQVVGAKILFDCTESKGSGIDYALAHWAVPCASNYTEQVMQIGPTAVYNLFGIGQDTVVKVALTLSRKNGTDPVTIYKYINISKNDHLDGKLIVNKNLEQSTIGKVLTLDVLKSTGPNIDWERTEWLINGQFSYRGPVYRMEIPASSEKTTIRYTCLLYRYGVPEPEVVDDKVEIGKIIIEPLITARRLSGTQHRMYELSVLDTPNAINVDWERTKWYIYDGGDHAVQLQGSVVGHEFPFRSEQMGYPVLVEMFLKGSSYPFSNYKVINIEEDELVPVITTMVDPNDPNLITFSAASSQGSNINWSQTKWSFGDGKEAQYGPVVTYKYPIDDKSATYKVTLTLFRTSVNGTQEYKMVTKEVRIGPDQVKAIIKATKYGDYLVLSAEESQGKGLLLDRCVWLFDGQGDSESLTQNIQGGTIRRQSYTKSKTNTRDTSYSKWTDSGYDDRDSDYTAGTIMGFISVDLPFYTYTGVRGDTNSNSQYGESSVPESWESVNYDDYKDEQYNFTSQNSQVGGVCRRYVGGKSNVVVTLFVYRMTVDGGVEGESITVVINLKDSNLSRGAVYGK